MRVKWYLFIKGWANQSSVWVIWPASYWRCLWPTLSKPGPRHAELVFDSLNSVPSRCFIYLLCLAGMCSKPYHMVLRKEWPIFHSKITEQINLLQRTWEEDRTFSLFCMLWLCLYCCHVFLVQKSPEAHGGGTALYDLTSHCGCDRGGDIAVQKVLTGDQKDRLGSNCVLRTDQGTLTKQRFLG